MYRLFTTLIALCICVGVPLTAQERPVTAAYTFEAGSAHIADTYLSPMHYDGWHLALDYRRYQAMKFDPERWVMELAGNATAERGQNRSGNSKMWNFSLDLSWAMMRKFRPAPGLTLAVGPGVRLNAGALYNPRNGNNPAAAKAAFTFDATGYAAYRCKIGHLPVTFMYQPSLPLVGAFFAPDYGEIYYEIYLGDHSGLAHCAWPGNYFMLDNLVTADLHLGATWLRVGYHGRISSSKANHIVTNMTSHALVIGISGEWLSLNPRKKLDTQARIISAIP